MSDDRSGTGPAQRRTRGSAGSPPASHFERTPFLTRTLAPFEVLDEEGLRSSSTTRIRSSRRSASSSGATRIPSGRCVTAAPTSTASSFASRMCRQIVLSQRPGQFTQYARNHANDVEIGGMHTVFAPNYGSPFVRDLDRGRRYGTEDFRNPVKLTYASPHLHHSGGTVCEPVDIPVNKRHLDMVYAHMRFSDKPFMGSVTALERARDTVEMARILFGTDYLEDHAVILSLINANSPLVWDATMTGSARAYAEANQATLMTPFILAGAMAPVTAAGVAAQTLAEALAGMTYVQLVRPGAPVVLGSFASSMSMQSVRRRSGPGARARPLHDGVARPPARRAVPFRRVAVRLEDPRRAGRLRECRHAPADGPRRRELRAACRRLARGRPHRRLREVHPRRRPMRDDGRLREGRRPLGERSGLDAIRDNGPGQHFLGTAHTLANFETAFYPSEVADNNSFEQWSEDGGLDAAQRANAIWKRMLAEYEAPPDRPGHRRGPPGVHDPAQGVDARLRGLSGALSPAHPSGTERPRRPGPAAVADLRADPAQAMARAEHLPPGATVSVTASPTKGLEATVELAAQLRLAGFTVVPTCRRGWCAIART